jgi:hypothetical protein
MRTTMPKRRHQNEYTIREAAWILGKDQSRVCRLMRVGALRSVPRRGRRAIPATELVRLLGQPVTDSPEYGSRA